MTYIIRYGSIAAVQYVTLPDGSTATAVYRAERTPPEFSLDASGRRVSLPLAVRDEIDRRFDEVFAVPVEEREPIVRRMQPVVMEA